MEIKDRCHRTFGPYRCTQNTNHLGSCSQPSILSMFLDKEEWIRDGTDCEICGEQAVTFRDFSDLESEISVEIKACQYVLLCKHCLTEYVNNEDES